MKRSLLFVAIPTVLMLSACGGGTESSSSSNNDQAVQRKMGEAKASLQEKADALARGASMSPPPPAKKQ